MSTSVPRGRRQAGLLAVAALAGGATLGGLGCRTTPFPVPLRPEVRVPSAPPPREGYGMVVGALADSATGDPVWRAVVYFTRDSVIGTGRATPRRDLPSDTTGRDGGFVLRDVPPGRYTLATDDLGYVPMRTVVVVHPGEVDTLVLRPRRLTGPP